VHSIPGWLGYFGFRGGITGKEEGRTIATAISGKTRRNRFIYS